MQVFKDDDNVLQVIYFQTKMCRNSYIFQVPRIVDN